MFFLEGGRGVCIFFVFFCILGYFDIFETVLDFFWFFFSFLGFLSKLLRLIVKVTKATTGHQKLPKMGQNSIISSFLPEVQKKSSAKGRSPPQELEVGPRSWQYLLVLINVLKILYLGLFYMIS